MSDLLMLVGGHRSGYMALMRFAALVHSFVGLAMDMIGIEMLMDMLDVLRHLRPLLGRCEIVKL